MKQTFRLKKTFGELATRYVQKYEKTVRTTIEIQ